MLSRVSHRFFSSSAAKYHNLEILRSTTLKSYVDSILPYAEILHGLQKKDIFTSKKIPHVMPKICVGDTKKLNLTALQLVTKPLPQLWDSSPDVINLPEPILSKVKNYIAILCDVFNSKLAQRNYEPGLPDRENISERDHGLQAAKIACQLGLTSEEVLAMLLHDIARTTVDSEDYGHQLHHLEGTMILAPLGMSLNFTYYHGFAKFLLYEFCPAYKKLISPLSLDSLKLQQKNLLPQIARLNQFNDIELAAFIQKIMLLRLIDDVSKVPKLLLEEELKSGSPNIEYFDDKSIAKMAYAQFKTYSLRFRNLNLLYKNLDAAIQLLLRAKEFSNNPELYTQLEGPSLKR